MPDTSTRDVAAPEHGLTPREAAHFFRVSKDRVLSWIRSGQLGAINTAEARCSRPRFVVLPEHLAEFARARQAATPQQPVRRCRRQTGLVDYYPECGGAT